MKKYIKKCFQYLLYLKNINQFNRKISHIYKLNSSVYKKDVSYPKLKAYKQKWSVLKRRVNSKWYKVYSSISGVKKENFVPEDIYYTVIEPRLNDQNFLLAYKDKNFYDQYFDKHLFPKALLRNVDGVYYDGEYNHIPQSDINSFLSSLSEDYEKIVIKPAFGASGGSNVRLFHKSENCFVTKEQQVLTLEHLEKLYNKNFLAQEYIEQHSFFRQFNSTSLNTVRIMTYRSVKTEDTSVLHAVQRMGRQGSIVDNQASGGISCGINEMGRLNAFAVDKFGRIYREFGAGLPFDQAGCVIKFEEMKALAKNIASKNYYARLLGFDFCVDQNECVRLIEINNKYLEINFLQMNNGPLFNESTDEIIQFCQESKSDIAHTMAL